MANTGRPLEAYRAQVAPDTQVYYNEWSVTASGLLNCWRDCLLVEAAVSALFLKHTIPKPYLC